MIFLFAPFYKQVYKKIKSNRLKNFWKFKTVLSHGESSAAPADICPHLLPRNENTCLLNN